MNIFFLDSNPIKCAEYHVDKHVVKMIVETAQLLSTTHRILDGQPTTAYYKQKPKTFYLLADEYIDQVIDRGEAKPIITNRVCYSITHQNHPSAKWVRESSANYKWAFELFQALLNEYSFRYNKEHKSIYLIDFLSQLPAKIPIGGLTLPQLVFDDKYKVLEWSEGNSFENYAIVNYQNYYRIAKEKLHSWTNRPTPYFITTPPIPLR